MDKESINCEIDLPFRFISNEEKKRRLDCLQDATFEVIRAEFDFEDNEENARSPFAGW